MVECCLCYWLLFGFIGCDCKFTCVLCVALLVWGLIGSSIMI